MDIQKLYSYTRKAVNDYSMIKDGDRVVAAVSGGKDSLALLYALSGLKRIMNDSFELYAMTVDVGYNVSYDEITKLCREFNIEYDVVRTDIKKILDAHDKGKAYCSLCARLRRGVFKEYMEEKGFNKLAYGHNKDDVIETSLMSLFYEGWFHCFAPVNVLDEYTVIRPLVYVDERSLAGFAKKYNLPVVKNDCPYDDNSKRSETKGLIKELSKENKFLKKNIFHGTTKLPEWKKTDG